MSKVRELSITGRRIILFGGKDGERDRDIKRRERASNFSDLFGQIIYLANQIDKYFLFNGQRLVGGGRKITFKLRQFRRGKADIIGKCLTMDEWVVFLFFIAMFDHEFVRVAGGDINKIAEHIIISDFERINACHLAIFGLQVRDMLLAVIAQGSEFIEPRIVTGFNKAAITVQKWEVGF